MTHQEHSTPTGRRPDEGRGQSDTTRTVQEGMLKSVNVRNFRVFDELSIDHLSRVNLIAGRNNSGKTSLLEALFLLAGGADPQMALNSNVVRLSNLPVSGPRDTLRETYWKPMFTELDMEKIVEIAGVHFTRGPLALRISLERQTVTELPIQKSGEASAGNISIEPALLFSFQMGFAAAVEGRMQIEGQSLRIDRPNVTLPFVATILSTQVMNHPEDAERLSRLRKQKKDARLLSALRIIEPRLQSIEVNSASGFPVIWGDIGLSELVPLAMMGDGMTRLARLVLAIAASPGGLVLVDEIETGLHHTVLSDIWRAVDEAANEFETQIVATTHSYECLQAAHQSLGGGGGFLLHRLEVSGSGNHCVTYFPEDIDAAIRHDLEVR